MSNFTIPSCCHACACFEPAVLHEYGNPEQCSFDPDIAHKDCPQLGEMMSQSPVIKSEAGHKPNCISYRKNGSCEGCLVDPCPVMPF